MIIPGHIGGRMVKWMEEIEVTAQESQNHYHFHDNRVLPSHIEEAQAKEEGDDSPVGILHTLLLNDLGMNNAKRIVRSISCHAWRSRHISASASYLQRTLRAFRGQSA